MATCEGFLSTPMLQNCSTVIEKYKEQYLDSFNFDLCIFWELTGLKLFNNPNIA
jgi:hypothetical protein